MTEREARIAFNMIPTVGAVTVERLAREAGGSVAEAYVRYPQKLDWEGREPDWEREIARAEKMHVEIVTDCDDAYPPQLREIASPPLALYVVGDVSALAKAGVALVGTRSATAYGRETAERFAFGLAQRGWAIFSGLARGIDAASHRGALTGGGVTVGVLGGALDQFYPEQNRSLAREMVEKGGCVASEFPFGRSPDVQTFPQRNRIVSGLSRGVVAIECPLKSGTLITCMRALEQSRAVMAVPGRIDWKTSEGCLHLIREGARMVTSVDDILEELSPLGKADEPPRQDTENCRPDGMGKVPEGAPRRGKKTTEARRQVVLPEVKLSLEESLVLREVPEEGTTIDAVTRATGLGAARVNALLVGLRLKGRIRLLPGNRVCTNHGTQRFQNTDSSR